MSITIAISNRLEMHSDMILTSPQTSPIRLIYCTFFVLRIGCLKKLNMLRSRVILLNGSFITSFLQLITKLVIALVIWALYITRKSIKNKSHHSAHIHLQLLPSDLMDLSANCSVIGVGLSFHRPIVCK